MTDLCQTLLDVAEESKDLTTTAVGQDEVTAARKLEKAGLVRFLSGGRKPLRVTFVKKV